MTLQRLRARTTSALTIGAAVALTAACTSPSTETDALEALPGNRYAQSNLAATGDQYAAPFTLPDMVNAWGVAIRPKGAGGHFWVGAGGTSFEFVGDVTASPDPALRQLHQDGLREVTVPGADSDTSEAGIGKTTGVIFNPAP
ncbi:TIGR03118 family protein, partial [Rhodococcus daqingensis]